jgi:transposase
MKNSGQCLTPFQRKLLLKNLQTELRPEYRRRIEIMLLADEGRSQSQICDFLGCAHETARYWMSMAQTGQAHQWKNRLMGRPKIVNDRYCDRLKELVSQSPREYGYSFQRWTAGWLGKHLEEELHIKVSDCHINRLLKQMGLSTRSKLHENKELEHNISPDSSNLEIRDLTSAGEPEHGEIWLFNSIH